MRRGWLGLPLYRRKRFIGTNARSVRRRGDNAAAATGDAGREVQSVESDDDILHRGPALPPDTAAPSSSSSSSSSPPVMLERNSSISAERERVVQLYQQPPGGALHMKSSLFIHT